MFFLVENEFRDGYMRRNLLQALSWGELGSFGCFHYKSIGKFPVVMFYTKYNIYTHTHTHTHTPVTSAASLEIKSII